MPALAATARLEWAARPGGPTEIRKTAMRFQRPTPQRHLIRLKMPRRDRPPAQAEEAALARVREEPAAALLEAVAQEAVVRAVLEAVP